VKHFILYIILICFGNCISYTASASNQALDSAALFYNTQQYQKALDIWYGLLEKKQVNAGLYFNIGLAESELGHTALSILAFEQALRLKPLHKEIQLALVEERKRIENAVIPVTPFFLSQWCKGFLTLLHPGIWAFIGLMLLLACILNALAVLKLFPSRFMLNQRKALMLGIGGCLMIIFAILSYHQIHRKGEFIINTMTEIRKAPSDESPVVRPIYAGEKVVIEDQIGDWYQVHLLNLDAGWMKNENLLPIRLH
jgi:tetratricopeptide (TPR) repeat protein